MESFPPLTRWTYPENGVRLVSILGPHRHRANEGSGADGKRSILGVSVAMSEAEVHWRQFFTDFQFCVLTGVELIISDDHAGFMPARAAVFPSIPCQRCQFQLQ